MSFGLTRNIEPSSHVSFKESSAHGWPSFRDEELSAILLEALALGALNWAKYGELNPKSA